MRQTRKRERDRERVCRLIYLPTIFYDIFTHIILTFCETNEKERER